VTTALIGVGGVVIGVLLGGGVQVGVEKLNSRAATRRAARLLFGDHLLALVAVRSMVGIGVWWSDETAPPLDDWRRYREALAGTMNGSDFQTVDGAFHRVADLERWRRAGLDAPSQADSGREAVAQLEEVGGILLQVGFKGNELKQMERELADDQANPWAEDGEDASPR
jgi:hypothetical protein